MCNPNLPSGERTVDRFFQTSCFQIQNPIRFGSAGRATGTGPVIQNLDVGFFKNTSITERIQTQFRAEFFNFANHPQWNAPNRFIDQASF